jgi:hypothetical protein
MANSNWSNVTLLTSGIALTASAFGVAAAEAKTRPSAALALSVANKSTSMVSSSAAKQRSLGDKHARRYGTRPDIAEDRHHGDGHDRDNDHGDDNDDHPKSP